MLADKTKRDLIKVAIKRKWRKITCDQCDVLVINNVVCHEHGCPNKNKGEK